MAPPGGVPENRIMIKDISEQDACAPQLNTLCTCEIPSAGATLEMSLYRLRPKRVSFFYYSECNIFDERFAHNIALAQQLLNDTHFST